MLMNIYIPTPSIHINTKFMNMYIYIPALSIHINTKFMNTYIHTPSIHIIQLLFKQLEVS